MKKRENCVLFFLIIIATFCHASSLNPMATYFSSYQTQSGDANWSITEDNQGRIYIGNESGLLEFDGRNWNMYPFPSATGVVRALFFDKESNLLFVGAYEEFGYYERDGQGQLKYRSLAEEVKKNYKMQNDEIWSIAKAGGKIYFQSFSSFFTYDGHQTTAICQNGELYMFFFSIGNKVYTDERTLHLSSINSSKNSLVREEAPLIQSRIIFGTNLPTGEKILVSEKDGIFKQNSQNSSWTRIDKMGTNYPFCNRAIYTSNNEIILATKGNGVIALDNQGDLQWNVTDKHGLKENSIECIFEDSDKNIWVAQNHGLAVIHPQSPFRSLTFKNKKIGTVSAAVKYGKYYYVGSENGLHKIDQGDLSTCIAIPQIKDKIWDLTIIDGLLFVGTNQKTYVIQGENAPKVLSIISGGMSIKRATIYGQDVLIQSTYSDLCVYRKNKQGEWAFDHLIKDFWQPIRYMEIDYQGNLWCAHLLRGLYKITLSKDLTKITNKSYFPSLNPQQRSEQTIYVHKLNNRVLFSNGEQFYLFNEASSQIEAATKLNKQLLDFKGATRITPSHNSSSYWLSNNSAAAQIESEGDNIKFIRTTSLSTLQSFFLEKNQFILPLNDGQALFIAGEGVALYNSAKSPTNFHHKTLFLSEIASINDNDEKVFFDLPLNKGIVNFPSSSNTIYLKCCYPELTPGIETRITYKLFKGKRLISSGTLPQRILSLSRLGAGKYTLKISAIDNIGRELSHFEVTLKKHPFFLFSVWAIIFYALALSALIYLIIRKREEKLFMRVQRSRVEFERKQKEEFIRLENEKLAEEVKYKGKELANYALLQLKQNEVLKTIKEELQEQKVTLGNQYPNKYFKKIVEIIETNLSSQDDWLIFEKNFDLIHEHFFRNLKERYPELTPNDLHLCGYLRLNLSSKEIAELMHISPKSVEIARYRLRKKIQLSETQSLVDFMITFK